MIKEINHAFVVIYHIFWACFVTLSIIIAFWAIYFYDAKLRDEIKKVKESEDFENIKRTPEWQNSTYTSEQRKRLFKDNHR